MADDLPLVPPPPAQPAAHDPGPPAAAEALAAPLRAPAELRVLLVAPTVRDGDASRRLLESAGLHCQVCHDLDRLCTDLDAGAAAVVVPEEAVLGHDGWLLAASVARQPVWSDLPVIVLTRAGATESPAVDTALATLGNVSLIERPLRVSTLLSVLRTALRARERQYQVRDQLEQQVRHEAALRDARDAAEAAKLAAEEAKAVAEAANHAKDRFLAALSHELRTPLSPVAVTLDSMANDAALPPALRDDVELIRRNIDLETKLIDDLLDLSRVANGKLRLLLQPTSVHDLLRHVLEICGAELKSKSLSVRFELGATADRVLADPARLRQVFWNLIKNAIKFTPAGRGVVLVHSSNPVPGRILIEVCDEGVGISAAALPHVFDAFEQGDVGHASQAGGLGLGLAISKAVVDMHGGRIFATSGGRGCGSTFGVELSTVTATDAGAVQPLVVAAPAVPIGVAAAAAGTNGHGPAVTGARPLRVLLVEDHPDTAKVMARLLAREGFVVRAAHTVADALELADAEPFDVLVSDIGLPDASGYELMRQLRDRHGLRGIALSGYGMEDDMRRSKEAGFDDHIVKPVNVTQLREAIRRMAADLPAR